MSTQPTAEAATVVPQWTLADRLRKARDLTGLDQGEFADRIGVSRATVSSAENGRTRPHPLVIRSWASASNVPVDWLVKGKADAPAGPGPDGGESREVVRRRARRDSNPQPSDPKVGGWGLVA